MKLEFPRQMLEGKSSNIKFVKICTVKIELLHANRRTYRQAGEQAGKYLPPPWFFVTLLHFSNYRSNWSSPSFSSTKFQNFSPGISDLLSEVSNFQHHKKLYSNCNTLRYKSNLPVKRSLLLSNAAFAMEILDLVSHLHLATFVIMLPKYMKYSKLLTM